MSLMSDGYEARYIFIEVIFVSGKGFAEVKQSFLFKTSQALEIPQAL